MMELQGALTAISTAVDIGKALLDVSKAITNAEIKNKIADLMLALSEAKMRIVNSDEELLNLKKENQELKEKIALRNVLEFKAPLYYKSNDNVPFCPMCWENNEKTIHLLIEKRETFGENFRCSVCNFYHTTGDDYADLRNTKPHSF